MTCNNIKVRKANGGYILTDTIGFEHIYTNLVDVFEYLLLHYEGLARTFSGYLFGRVVIELDYDAFHADLEKD